MAARYASVAVEQPVPRAEAPVPSPQIAPDGLIRVGHCTGFGLVVRVILWGFRNSGS